MTSAGTTRNYLLVVMLSGLFLSVCSIKSSNTTTRYITWESLEPDSWASVWLIKRHIDPNGKVVLRPTGAPASNGVAFGLPGAKYQRTRDVSIYESLRLGYSKEDPALVEIGRIIHDIEIMPWAARTSAHSGTVEQAYRVLQDGFPSRDVPVDCYGRFFDTTYELLSQTGGAADWTRLQHVADSDPACRGETGTLARRDLSPFVRRLETITVLDHIAADKKVVFIDVREPAEFDEFHIPGAVNIPFRNAAADVAQRYAGADLVIPYCIKDFRGFEMARSLAELGLQNVGIMQPYGIAGWRQQGLPLVNVDGLSETDAHDRLVECARAGTCIRSRS